MWRSLFLVNLQACRLIAGNFTNRWTPSQVFFNSVLSPPCSPHVLTQAPPLNFEEPPCSQHLWETGYTASVTLGYWLFTNQTHCLIITSWSLHQHNYYKASSLQCTLVGTTLMHTCQHTHTTSLMHVKNSTPHFCLLHLLSQTLQWRKWKNDKKHQIE